MIRHKKHSHVDDSEDAMDDSTSETEDFGMGESASEDEMASGSSHKADGKKDPWEDLVELAFQNCDDTYQEEVDKLMQKDNISSEDARKEVYDTMRSTYRKAIMNQLMKRLGWFNVIKKDPIYKAIRKTALDLIRVDDYEPEEAWKSAVRQRKYLLDKLLDDYEPSYMIQESDEDQDEDASASGSDNEDAEDDNKNTPEETAALNRGLYNGFNPVIIPPKRFG